MPFTDPASGRPYEIGPDGRTRWVDEPRPASNRPWYRRVRFAAPLAAVLGLGLGAASEGGGGTTAAGTSLPGPTVTRTTTVGPPPGTTAGASTAAPATRPTAGPTSAPPVVATGRSTSRPAVTRTVKVTVTVAPVTRTVTRTATARATGRTTRTMRPTRTTSGVHDANCSAARAAGDTPLYAGDPGYRAGLDRDDDGVACE